MYKHQHSINFCIVKMAALHIKSTKNVSALANHIFIMQINGQESGRFKGITPKIRGFSK